MSRENHGLLLGLVGVIVFSLTLPMTRLAVAHLDPFFVGLGRSVLASVIAAAVLLATRSRWPTALEWKSLAITACGVVLGFPALTSWAMRYVPSAHGAIVVGLLPLATAAIGAWRNHERPSTGFWVMSIVGSALVIAFAIYHGGGALHVADLALLLAVLLGAMGYAEGAKLTKSLGGWQTSSWVLIVSLPVLLPVVGWFATTAKFDGVPWQAWGGFLYVALLSQYIGFFAWYKGLDLGGVARVSQVQLLQVFLTMLFSALLLGETVTVIMFVFALAVVASVAIGRRMPIARND
jgi:drug/metabolite transporter (DMT)-like permease